MDVDEPNDASHNDNPDSLKLVEELNRVLDGLNSKPRNVRLRRRQISLMIQLGMVQEATKVVATLTTTTFIGESLWIEFLKAKVHHHPLMNRDALKEILDLFASAEQEYLSVDILSLHVNLLVSLSRDDIVEQTEPTPTADSEVKEDLTPKAMRDMLRSISYRANGLLSNSQPIWQHWIDWELGRYQQLEGADKQEQLNHVHEVYMERLQVPHATLGETATSYSSFLSAYCPDEYESRMVKITELSQTAKHKFSAERRHGKTRADFEEQLMYSSDIGHQAETLLAYIDWETDAIAKKPKGRNAPRQDLGLTCTVFERAAVLYGNAAATAESTSFEVGDPLGDDLMRETTTAYKVAEAMVWVRYVDWASENLSVDECLTLSDRATRACPGSGQLWIRRLNKLEADGNDTGIEAAVEQAKSLIVDNDEPVTTLADVLCAHVAIVHRLARELDPSVEHPVFLILAESLELISSFPGGDSSLRLEQFLVEWTEAFAPSMVPEVLAILDQPVKSRLTSHRMVILRAELEARHGDIEGARTLYSSAIQRADLDWPEAVYESFMLFENVYGTLESLLDARKRIDREQQKVNRRREKVAAIQSQQSHELAPQPSVHEAIPVAAIPATAPTSAPEVTTDRQDSVEVPKGVTSSQPEAPAVPPPSSEAEVQPKRDRENTTILVTGLKQGTLPDHITHFFETCGAVRECTILPNDVGAAMLEFKFRDSIPAALERDNKKLDGRNIRVSMLWRSTLFVTNFPKETDDKKLRELFGQYGTILETRWPSRKYGPNRRFCYLTMGSPAAAQEALVLNGFKINGEFPMKVAVSDPSAKAKRTDAAAGSIVFVGRLSTNTTEDEVRGLFKPVGTVRGVKWGWDREKKTRRGFAFVEMSTEAEAKAALTINGTTFHGKELIVELNDRDHEKKTPARQEEDPSEGKRQAAERLARQIRIYNIPEGSQEGLLQQYLEKLVPVKRLEIFGKTGQALAELESQNDAGLLLMRTEPFEFNGALLHMGYQEDFKRRGAPVGVSSSAKGSNPSDAAGAVTSSLAFAPRTRNRAKVLGRAYIPPKAAVAAGTMPPPSMPQDTKGTAPSGTQDMFRQFVTATNEQRRDKLHQKVTAGSKRALEGSEGDAMEVEGGESGPVVADLTTNEAKDKGVKRVRISEPGDD